MYVQADICVSLLKPCIISINTELMFNIAWLIIHVCCHHKSLDTNYGAERVTLLVLACLLSAGFDSGSSVAEMKSTFLYIWHPFKPCKVHVY